MFPLVILGVFGLFLPRLALFLCYLFGAFSGVPWGSCIFPVLGFVFLPYTTLAYGFAYAAGPGLQGIWLVLVVLGVLADLGALGGSAQTRKRSRA